MSVKIHLMLNSKMLIDANADTNGDSIVATSLLEASNLVVLKVLILAILHSYSGTLIFIAYSITHLTM